MLAALGKLCASVLGFVLVVAFAAVVCLGVKLALGGFGLPAH